MREANNIGEYAKVTWGDLKQLVENSGISDEDEIDLIDIAWCRVEEIKVIRDDDFGWQIFL